MTKTAATRTAWKFCSACDLNLPAGAFPANRANLDGLGYYCRPCTKAKRERRKLAELGLDPQSAVTLHGRAASLLADQDALLEYMTDTEAARDAAQRELAASYALVAQLQSQLAFIVAREAGAPPADPLAGVQVPRLFEERARAGYAMLLPRFGVAGALEGAREACRLVASCLPVDAKVRQDVGFRLFEVLADSTGAGKPLVIAPGRFPHGARSAVAPHKYRIIYALKQGAPCGVEVLEIGTRGRVYGLSTMDN
jgi:hypothetical protein